MENEGVIVFINNAKKGQRVIGSTKEVIKKLDSLPREGKKFLEEVLEWNSKRGK
jgi:hypothetical protein